MRTCRLIVGSALVRLMMCDPEPGMANVIVIRPLLAFALMIAERAGVGTPAVTVSSVVVTANGFDTGTLVANGEVLSPVVAVAVTYWPKGTDAASEAVA